MKILLFTAVFFCFAQCNKGNVPTPDPNVPSAPKTVWRVPFSDVIAPTDQPVIYNDVVVYSKMVNSQESFVAFDKNKGQKLWEWSDGKNSFYNHDYKYAFNGVLAATTGPKVYGVDIQTGKTKWTVKSPDVGASEIGGIGENVFHFEEMTVAGKTVVTLKNININTGSEAATWQHTTYDDYQPNFRKVVTWKDTNGDTLLYFYNQAYTFLPKDSLRLDLYCFNFSKKTQAYKSTFFHSTSGVGVCANEPIIKDGKIYLTVNRRMLCLNQNDGKKLWQTQEVTDGNLGFLTVEAGKAFVSNDYKGVYCYDSNTGSLLWQDLDNSSLSSRIAYVNGLIYFTTFGDGFLHIFEVSSGKKLFKYDLSQGVGFQGVMTLDNTTKKLYLATVKDAICLEPIR